jgi:hypothetical protein
MTSPFSSPDQHRHAAEELHEALRAGLSRRELIERGLLGLLMAGGIASLLSGCSSGTKGGSGQLSGLPNTKWPMEEVGKNQYKPTPSPLSKNNVVRPEPPENGAVIPRSAWAGGEPITRMMDRADRAYNRITVHHDGTTAFTTTSRDAAARRLEQIRQAHLRRPKEPFGDIGYHYLIDPAGRVWQGRDTSWQGAHVAKQNEGNLGICMLGNYNLQQPNGAQRAALDRFVRTQMSYYGIGINQVRTHRELAQTECPGSSLQMYMVATRRAGMSATA